MCCIYCLCKEINIVHVQQFFHRHLKGLLTLPAATVCVYVQSVFCYLYLAWQLTSKTGLRIEPILQYRYSFCQVLCWGKKISVLTLYANKNLRDYVYSANKIIKGGLPLQELISFTILPFFLHHFSWK